MNNSSEELWEIQSNCIGGDGDSNCISGYHGYSVSPINTAKNVINRGLFVILITGLIIGTYLIYHKHKGEKGLWKRFLKWSFIYILIIFILWIGFSLLFWHIGGPFANPQSISFEN